MFRGDVAAMAVHMVLPLLQLIAQVGQGIATWKVKQSLFASHADEDVAARVFSEEGTPQFCTVEFVLVDHSGSALVQRVRDPFRGEVPEVNTKVPASDTMAKVKLFELGTRDGDIGGLSRVKELAPPHPSVGCVSLNTLCPVFVIFGPIKFGQRFRMLLRDPPTGFAIDVCDFHRARRLMKDSPEVVRARHARVGHWLPQPRQGNGATAFNCGMPDP